MADRRMASRVRKEREKEGQAVKYDPKRRTDDRVGRSGKMYTPSVPPLTSPE
jgi:hypothetical protein